VLDQIMSGQCTDAQIASLLTALRMKGETVDEVTGFARVMRRKAASVKPEVSAAAAIGGTEREALIDTCGTGGDVSGSFNVSTATAFVVAGAGVRVAKHGNRSASSQCGSADVVEALGIKVELSPERIARCIDQVGIGFLHAPLLHDAMKYVALARRQMGIRTIFNMLGPLTNPAGANAQLVGVYAAELTEVLAEVLNRLGTSRAIVAHGSDGMDEITITGSTRITELRDGKISTYTVHPEELGITPATLADIRGGDASENANLILKILGGETGPRRDIVLMNAAAALAVSGKASSFQDGLGLAAESIAGGNALEKLERLIEFTNS
ncbi:MAG: anthranilate phosphoribosyltransferase, partial [Blastocatellia bacterium]